MTGSFSYTYSHALDEVSNGGYLPFSVINGIETQIDPYNLHDNYASADYDARHQLNASYIYELPFKSGNRLLNTAIAGGNFPEPCSTAPAFHSASMTARPSPS